tara:strand:- start:1378 stop:2055 length:678 start_codon:yes stop_codon:yes gene_type:complete
MNFSKYLKGGSCNTVGKITTPTCGNIDIGNYQCPCDQLPLDNFKNQIAGCSAPTKDCLNNTISQLGVSPSCNNYPAHNNLSELSFSARFHTGKTAGGSRQKKSKTPKASKKKTTKKATKKNQEGGGFYFDVNKSKIGGLPEVGNYVDCNPPANPEMSGGGEFTRIINPVSGRKVSIYGKTGMKVLRNYLQQLQGGATTETLSNFDPNMTTRQFGCRQPTWTPDCI